MQQLLQSLHTGTLTLTDIPYPQNKENHIIVQTTCSLISSGTERMLLEFGRANLFSKIKQQPEKVAQVISKIKTDGIVSTLEAVKSKLDQPIALGYCQAGVITEIGAGCSEFSIGDRVVTNGPHAEIVRVSKNLAAKIPENVDDESAAFAVIGAIALQGIRLANPTLGETFAVMGLGLVGQLAAQLLLAQGCRVLGIDFDAQRCALAKKMGAEIFQLQNDRDPVLFAENFSRQQGLDGVLITTATDSDAPIKQATAMCRKRGRIVLVGVAGTQLSRDDFYKKELSFQVSCSYGPGRYDDDYEKKGQDYPIGYVRWTEKRNIEAVLDMLSLGKINVAALITHRFIFSEAVEAYSLLNDKSALGILLKYPNIESVVLSGKTHCNTISLLDDTPMFALENEPSRFKSRVCRDATRADIGDVTQKRNSIAMRFNRFNISTSVSLSCIGAGNFVARVLLPIFKKNKVLLHTIVTDQGVHGVIHGKKNGFYYASTDYASVLNQNEINTVLIATPHYLHAEQTVAALQAGKHVYVEKPLAITEDQLKYIRTAYLNLSEKPILMIGFNRRFSPFIKRMKQLLDALHEPKNMIMTVNAGYISKSHWTQDSKIGGGRLLGEVCHFVDLLRYIAGAAITSSNIISLNCDRFEKNENVSITLTFSNGSIGTIHYFANGAAAYPKERLEVFCAGKILVCDNFKKLTGFGFSKFSTMRTFKQQKGHAEAIHAFLDAIQKNHASPIAFEEMIEVAEVCLKLNKIIRAGSW